MQHKIAIEEHFSITDTLGVTELDYNRVVSIFEKCLRDMDQNGMDIMVMSLNNPGLQGIYDIEKSKYLAKKINDLHAKAISRYPDRFRGWAALPLQDPDAAAEELTRCVKDLGFVGFLANGFSQIGSADNYTYYDAPMYRNFWKEVEKLDVPFYLHPRKTAKANAGIYEGHEWLTDAAWSFGVETATHILRMMCSGLFDECPNLKVILGHLGEMLPFAIWRTENRFIHKKRRENGMPAKLSMLDYMQKNIWYTTSGQMHDPSLHHTMLEFGSDRIMFAIDYPYETIKESCEWFDSCQLSEVDRQKIGRDNASKLLKIY